MTDASEYRKTFVEFFAGIGLVHRGLKAGRWRCEYANDIDPKKRTMYAAAFGDEGAYHLEDVWNIDAVLGRIGPKRPLLATASFPCTDLSTAGRYEGLGGKHSSTFFAFADVLAGLAKLGRQPPMVMIENVPGLLTSRGGDDFRIAAMRLAELGYHLDAMIVDASRFTPQSRPRLFIIGAMAGAIDAERVESGSAATLFGADDARPCEVRPPRLLAAMRGLELPTGWVRYRLEPLPQLQTTLADVVDTDAAQPWWPTEQVERHLAMMSDLHAAKVATIRGTGAEWIGTIFRRIRKGVMRAEVRFDGLAGCLRTPKGGSARQIVIGIEGDRTRMRWMTPREYARLQGAGDFPIDVADTQAMFGFGDAVCVPVIEWIDRQILTPLARGANDHGRRIRTVETI